jgi:transcriptional regulator with XRE-family HTH domain
MHIGVKIKIARITKGYTQEQLAEKINKTRPLVSHIEQTGKVNAYTLKKICQVLEISQADLENEVSEPNSHYHKENASAASEIRRLKEELATVKDLVNMQKEVIMELKEKILKLKPKKKIKGA